MLQGICKAFHADLGADGARLTGAALRARVEHLERLMIAMPEAAHVRIEPRHYFAQGLYAREILIPKGTLLTGRAHRFSHINVISQGEISVLTDNGVERIKAPATIVSQPGIKRVGYAHEDTVWTTFHATEETDVSKMELVLGYPTQFELEAQSKEAPCLS